jgi:hypothetical protein
MISSGAIGEAISEPSDAAHKAAKRNWEKRKQYLDPILAFLLFFCFCSVMLCYVLAGMKKAMTQ